MRRILSVVAASLVAAATCVVPATAATATQGPPQPPRHIKTSPYVALGDSYSAGAGIPPQVAGAPATCSRSWLNYPHVIAAVTEPKTFTDVTCAGAQTLDFFTSQAPGVTPQLDALDKRTRLVTMTIGGNDGDAFGRILRGCIEASVRSGSILGNPCEQKYRSTFTDLVGPVTYPHLVAALTAVRARAPLATVVILGYPQVMPEKGVLACYPAMPISMGDVAYVNQWEDVLNGAVAKAAAETGARYVDTAAAFADHDVCQAPGQRWIEPVNGAINAAAVHPNAAGEAAMAKVTLQQLGVNA